MSILSLLACHGLERCKLGLDAFVQFRRWKRSRRCLLAVHDKQRVELVFGISIPLISPKTRESREAVVKAEARPRSRGKLLAL